jgi:hypothetical protein
MNGSDDKIRRPAGWHALRALVVLIGLGLTPVFFMVMFRTVITLERSSFGWQAWSVPAATEGAFAFLFCMDVLLMLARKPMGWLRFVPYPFAAISLALNVWAYLHDVPGLLGHAVVTAAFFVPLVAAETAVRSMSVPDREVAVRAEREAACRYAMDLLADSKGMFWRWRSDVPSLLKSQVRKGRLPADVTESLAGGPRSWEPAVRAFVVKGLTAGAWMKAEESVTRRRIEQSAVPAPVPAPAPSPAPSPAARSGASKQDQVRVVMKDHPDWSQARIAKELGVHPSTVERAVRSMKDGAAEGDPPEAEGTPRRLRAVGERGE